jgi:hypothetical protein
MARVCDEDDFVADGSDVSEYEPSVAEGSEEEGSEEEGSEEEAEEGSEEEAEEGGAAAAAAPRRGGGAKAAPKRTAPRCQRMVEEQEDADLAGCAYPGLAYCLVRGQRQTVNVATSAKNLGAPGKSLLSHGIGIYPMSSKGGAAGMCQVTTGLQLNHCGSFIYAPGSKRNALRFSTGNFDNAGKGKRASCIIFMEFYRMVRCWLRGVRASRAAAGAAAAGADAAIPCGDDAHDGEDADTLAFDYTPLRVTPDTQTLINKAVKLFERYRQAVQFASGGIQVEKSAVSLRGHLSVKLAVPRISKTVAAAASLRTKTLGRAAAKAGKGGGGSKKGGAGGSKAAAASGALAAGARKRLEARVAEAERNWPALHALLQHCFTQQWTLTPAVEVPSGAGLLHAVWRYAILCNDEDAMDVLLAVAEAEAAPAQLRQVAKQALAHAGAEEDALNARLAQVALSSEVAAAFHPQPMVDHAAAQARAVLGYRPLPLPLPLPAKRRFDSFAL